MWVSELIVVLSSLQSILISAVMSNFFGFFAKCIKWYFVLARTSHRGIWPYADILKFCISPPYQCCRPVRLRRQQTLKRCCIHKVKWRGGKKKSFPLFFLHLFYFGSSYEYLRALSESIFRWWCNNMQYISYAYALQTKRKTSRVPNLRDVSWYLMCLRRDTNAEANKAD